MSAPMAVRRPRRAVIALAGGAGASGAGEPVVQTLAQSLGALGVETLCLGRIYSAERIAAAVSHVEADAVELCLAEGAPGVLLLRELLRELIRIDRREVSIVVHRV